ncbi:hypothetical protein QFZ56_005933 [Streptomyces achromogenes]|uniref:Uncharacterized protein n=1 Tax=Streptomyces achromogenes TaxID=67255 RepID=A0ABU0QAW4_STRAH|nr:hypothetical protein [Streptomyces achromogenes]
MGGVFGGAAFPEGLPSSEGVPAHRLVPVAQ